MIEGKGDKPLEIYKKEYVADPGSSAFHFGTAADEPFLGDSFLAWRLQTAAFLGSSGAAGLDKLRSSMQICGDVARRRSSVLGLAPSEPEHQTARITPAILLVVCAAREPGGQGVGGVEIGVDVIQLCRADGEVPAQS
jgi:hypothetical protein